MRTAVLLSLHLLATPLPDAPPLPLYRAMEGREATYTVRSGDNLHLIAGRHGVGWRVVAEQNGLPPPYKLRAGQTLTIRSRWIVPPPIDGILINLPEARLYLYREGKLHRVYGLGMGMPTWKTPEGDFIIRSKAYKPTWHVPPSIQKELAEQGKEVRTVVPPGPDNPLGEHWLQLSLPGYGIHGTIAPASIGQFRSHGCIRVHPDDMAELFDLAEKDTPVTIFYAPVKLARTEDGRIFLEAHRDIYKQAPWSMETLRHAAAAHGLTERIDWKKAETVLHEKTGQAEEITWNAKGG
jgi:L,D-transpeptidase ErfK/SrfK